MKNNIQQLLDQVKQDNAQYINENHNGSFSDYLKYNFEENPEDFYWYLSDEEAESWNEKTEQEREVIFNDIRNLIAAQ